MEGFNLAGFNIWMVVKILVLVILGLYIIFAFVIQRQVKVMTDTLTLGFEAVAKFLSFMHLIFSVLVFLTALFVL